MKKCVFIVAVLIFSTGTAISQDSQFDRSRLNTAAFYNYSEVGDVTINIHVWGSVRFPGYYEVARGTKLSELVSLAGGPMFAERSRRSQRTISVRLHRNEGAGRSIVYLASMQNEVVVTENDPELQDDDVLSFATVVRSGFSWRDIFPIVSMAATLTLLYDRAAN